MAYMQVDRQFRVTIIEEDELEQDSVSDEERDLAIAEAARIQEAHDEAHRRFDEKCRELGEPRNGPNGKPVDCDGLPWFDEGG